MHSFAQKSKTNQHLVPASSSKSSCANDKPSRVVSSMLHLQRTIGNQAVIRFKLNTPKDRFEREAYRIAGKILQRKTPDKENKNVDIGVIASRQAASDNHEVYKKLENRLSRNTGCGFPVSDQFRAFIEPRMQFDFSRVRIHTDNESVRMNQELMARAFTHGQDIYFGCGQYNPQSIDGRRLLAHELVHVAQQTDRHPTSFILQKSPSDNAPDNDVTYMITDREFSQIEHWLNSGHVGIEQLTGDQNHDLDVITIAIFCNRLIEIGELEHDDPLLCIDESVTRQDPRYQPVREQVSRGLRTIPEPGQLTAAREGDDLRIHWPRGISGVTIGRGYDLGTRTPATIRGDLARAGFPPGQIAFLVGAAGLRGAAAEAWVVANAADPRATITVEQRETLFRFIWPGYVERAHRRATHAPPAGQSFVSNERWRQLHPSIREILTDLAYVGAPYAGERREQINMMLMDESLSTLEQLRWLRAYIENLPENLQGRNGRELRLLFIDEIISQLET